MKSYYYQDERLTIIQHDGLYDIYDTKVKGRLKCKDATKQMADMSIKSVQKGRELKELRLKRKAEREMVLSNG